MKPRLPQVTGRGWAYLGAILGGAVSIAANVAHSYVPPADAGPGWAPQGGAVVASVFWPVALFVAVEILARIPWPAGRRRTLLRYGGLLPVAAVAAFVSYQHLAGLLAFYGEDPLTATLGPLAVDGLMVMATGTLLATSTSTRPTPTTAAEATPPVPAHEDQAATFEAAAAVRDASAVPARPTAVVPMPAGTFTRLNGTTVTSEVSR